VERDPNRDVVHRTGDALRSCDNDAFGVIGTRTCPATQAAITQLERCLPDILERDCAGPAAQSRVGRALRCLDGMWLGHCGPSSRYTTFTVAVTVNVPPSMGGAAFITMASIRAYAAAGMGGGK